MSLPSWIAFPGEPLWEVMLRTCCSQRASRFRVGDGAKSSADRLTLFGISSTSSAIVASPFGRSARIPSMMSAISLSVIRDIQLLRFVKPSSRLPIEKFESLNALFYRVAPFEIADDVNIDRLVLPGEKAHLARFKNRLECAALQTSAGRVGSRENLSGISCHKHANQAGAY